MKVETEEPLSRRGLILALGTYSVWGLFPLYFKMLADIPSTEVLAHRIVWSFAFTAVLVFALGLLASIKTSLSRQASLKYFGCSSALIAVNWLLYVYGVAIGEVLELSLAFFINPIFNVIFGMLFFKERLSLSAKLAVALVVLGLMVQLLDIRQFPVLALALALVFSLYGAVRKRAAADSVSGLFVETAVLMPFALAFLLIYARDGSLSLMQQSWTWTLVLMLSGPLTSLPLIAFAMAVKRIPYYLLGFCQYLTPTFLMLLALVLYGERLNKLDLATFSLVWMGILLSIGPRFVKAYLR